MNLAQLIDPVWVQEGKPRRSWERREADPALVAAMIQAEAERTVRSEAERIREATARQRLVDQQADREAEASRARAASTARLRVPAPPPLAEAPAPIRAAPAVKGGRPWSRTKGLKSVRILRVLSSLSRPQTVASLSGLLPDIKRGSIHAYLVGFVERGHAVRFGESGAYRFAIGAAGKQYLATFHSPG